MRSTLFLIASLAIAPLSVLASADIHAAGPGVVARSGMQHKHREHAHVARANKKSLSKRSKGKRCKAPISTSKAAPTSTKAAEPAATSKKIEEEKNNGGTNGVISVKGGSCGSSGATQKTTATTGPNGSLDFLTCGIHDGGWRPPHIGLEDIKYVDLYSYPASETFKQCGKFFDLFHRYAGQYNIPPIMLASFAMQESSCNPSTTGGGGEAGLFQLAGANCNGAPGGNCHDVDFNTRTAAKYFAGQVKDNGGNVLVALGAYNGWFVGMTYEKATAAAHSGCCKCQNNLDYPHQYLNGWLQGIDAYSGGIRLGKYFNLDVCNK